jgi:hypothetical protein
MGYLLHVGAQVKCFHQTGAFRLTGSQRVKVDGKQVWTTESTLTVPPSCPFKVGTKPQPCSGVEWTLGAGRVKAGGKAVVLRESAPSALCKSAEGVPQGVPSVTSSQTRVRGL